MQQKCRIAWFLNYLICSFIFSASPQKMNQSFADKLARLKTTTEERLQKIEVIKKEIENETLEINQIISNTPDEFMIETLKFEIAEKTFFNENVKHKIQRASEELMTVKDQINKLEESKYKTEECIRDIIMEVTNESLKLRHIETEYLDYYGMHREMYLMTCEDIQNYITLNAIDSIQNDSIPQSLIWKRKVLSSTIKEREGLEVELKNIEKDIENIVSSIMT